MYSPSIIHHSCDPEKWINIQTTYTKKVILLFVWSGNVSNIEYCDNGRKLKALGELTEYGAVFQKINAVDLAIALVSCWMGFNIGRNSV